jgi:hypothetical protein
MTDLGLAQPQASARKVHLEILTRGGAPLRPNSNFARLSRGAGANAGNCGQAEAGKLRPPSLPSPINLLTLSPPFQNFHPINSLRCSPVNVNRPLAPIYNYNNTLLSELNP